MSPSEKPQISPLRCAPVEMTKERAAAGRELCYWNGEACRFPKVLFRTSLTPFPGKRIHTEISPLRCAPVEMTKERAAAGRERIHTEISPLRCAPVEMTKERAAAGRELCYWNGGACRFPKVLFRTSLTPFPGKCIHTEISPLRCAPVEMTKERAAAGRELCYWNGGACRFPKVFFRTSLTPFPGKRIHTEISPLRCAPVEMTKERAAAGRELCYWNGGACRFPKVLFRTSLTPFPGKRIHTENLSTSLRSGRDDKGEGGCWPGALLLEWRGLQIS